MFNKRSKVEKDEVTKGINSILRGILGKKDDAKLTDSEKEIQRQKRNREITAEIKQLEAELETVTTKKERKKIKKRMEKLKRKLDTGFNGEAGFTSPFGYVDDDSYLFVGRNTVISVFDVMFEYGTNNPAPIGWLNNVIPRDTIRHGEFIFITRQHGMDKDTEQDIISHRINENSEGYSEEETTNAREKNQNSQRVRDLQLAGILAGKEETIVDEDLLLIVKASSPENIELALEELRDAYKNDAFKGVMLVRKTGLQLETLRDLFDAPIRDARHTSSMLSVSATRLLLPSSGFSDEDGENIGRDINSIIPNQYARLNLANIRNAVIFSGDTSANVKFDNLGTQPSPLEFGGSTMATVLGKALWLGDKKQGIYGKRTHHILLNNYSYILPDSLVFDMKHESINPLEVFGTPETVKDDAEASMEKTVNMMMLLAGIDEDTDEGKFYRSELDRLLLYWYINNAKGSGIYTDDPENNPRSAQKILADEHHDKFPTMKAFLPVLLNNVAKRKADGEKAHDRADYLYSTMDTLFKKNKMIFDTTTTLPDVYTRDQRNIYYDLSGVSHDKRVKGAVLLNTLAYVVNRALEGESVIIHGLDAVDIKEKMLLKYRDIMKRRGVGKVVVFEESGNDKVNPETFKRFTGQLNAQDLLIIGGLTDHDFVNVPWFNNLPTTAKGQLSQRYPGVFFVYRNYDRISSVISTNIELDKGGIRTT
ncbi:hypothetical protein [Ligilactobacillus equi]|uniref:Uncharacterized protein n=1 Tax=Ligilactobacillus equi DSM 15833 = JCM 10991 TaxID=1423740 RepID=A0A0R1TKS9_9LACO|nr:hypothetical protein [Ligilactobacillus equi]KRL79205.1 hypothetical protein FC36_GL000858 [Ligilactobacillus equi DSM 15833 = JCM 10991]